MAISILHNRIHGLTPKRGCSPPDRPARQNPPRKGMRPRPPDRGGQRALDQIRAQRTVAQAMTKRLPRSCSGAVPVFTFVRLLSCPFFSGRTTRTHQFPLPKVLLAAPV